MAQLVVGEDLMWVEDSDDEMVANPDDVNNYKGMFQNEEDETIPKYFEGGAHFPYQLLCDKLIEISVGLPTSRGGGLEDYFGSDEEGSPEPNDVRSPEEATVATGNNLLQSVQGINKEQHFRRIVGNSKDPKETKVSFSNSKIKTNNMNIKNFLQAKSNNQMVLQTNKKSVNLRDKSHIDDNKVSIQSKVTQDTSKLQVPESNNLNGIENYFFLAINNGGNNVKSRNLNNNIDTVYKLAANGVPVNNINLISAKDRDNYNSNKNQVFNVNNNYNQNSNLNNLNKSPVNHHLSNKTTKVIKEKTSSNTHSHIVEKNSTNTSRNIINLNLNNHLTDFGQAPKLEEKRSNDAANQLSSFTNDIINFHYQKTKALNKKGDELLRGVGFLKKSNLAGNLTFNPSKNLDSTKIKLTNGNKDNLKITDLHANKNFATSNKTTLKESSQCQALHALPNFDIKTNKKDSLNIPIKTNTIYISNSNLLNSNNLKQGRNISSGLNPHQNTILENKLKITKEKTKKLSYDKSKGEVNRIINSQLDNKNNKNGKIKETFSPNVNMSGINIEKINNSQPQIDKENSNPNPNQSQKPVSTIAFNEIVSTICHNTENKSRNAARNNLNSTKSNLYSSEKAQSLQSGSYQKSHIFTHANLKTGQNPNSTSTNNKTTFKPKVGLINKTNLNAGSGQIRNNVGNVSNAGNVNIMNKSLNKSKTNTMGEEKSKVNLTHLLKKSVKPTGNTNLNVNQASTKKGVVNSLIGNNVNNNVNNNVLSNAIHQQSTKIEMEKNKPSLLVIKESSPYSSKNHSQNFKVNSNCSHLKTKTNSVTSNLSNGVISSTVNNNNVIKNYTFNKYATKVSNVTFLNLKKNEYSIARSQNLAPSDKSSKTFLNTLSTGSQVNERRSSHDP